MPTPSELLTPVLDLAERYRLKSKASLYERIKAAGIQLEKVGRRSYVNPDQLKRLDELDQHLGRGGALQAFRVGRSGDGSAQPDVTELKSPVSAAQLNRLVSHTLQQMLSTWADSVTSQVVEQIQTIQDPVRGLRILDEAVERQWILSASQVEACLGIKPSGRMLHRQGYKLIRVGSVGTETGWMVARERPPVDPADESLEQADAGAEP